MWCSPEPQITELSITWLLGSKQETNPTFTEKVDTLYCADCICLHSFPPQPILTRLSWLPQASKGDNWQKKHPISSVPCFQVCSYCRWGDSSFLASPLLLPLVSRPPNHSHFTLPPPLSWVGSHICLGPCFQADYLHCSRLGECFNPSACCLMLPLTCQKDLPAATSMVPLPFSPWFSWITPFFILSPAWSLILSLGQRLSHIWWSE